MFLGVFIALLMCPSSTAAPVWSEPSAAELQGCQVYAGWGAVHGCPYTDAGCSCWYACRRQNPTKERKKQDSKNSTKM